MIPSPPPVADVVREVVLVVDEQKAPSCDSTNAFFVTVCPLEKRKERIYGNYRIRRYTAAAILGCGVNSR